VSTARAANLSTRQVTHTARSTSSSVDSAEPEETRAYLVAQVQQGERRDCVPDHADLRERRYSDYRLFSSLPHTFTLHTLAHFKYSRKTVQRGRDSCAHNARSAGAFWSLTLAVLPSTMPEVHSIITHSITYSCTYHLPIYDLFTLSSSPQ
jgi:hypothetical protein